MPDVVDFLQTTDPATQAVKTVYNKWIRFVDNINPANTYVSITFTDLVGAFKILAVPPGTYTVYVGPSSTGPWTVTEHVAWIVPAFISTNAGDIQPLGITAAGATGKAADAGHIHSSGGIATDTTVVHNTGNENVAGVKTFTSAPVVPSNAFPESAVTNLTTDLAAKAVDAAVVHNTGNETIAGTKTFSSAPAVPDGSFPEAKVSGLVTDLAAKATDSLVAHLAGTETVTGKKIFSGGLYSKGLPRFHVAAYGAVGDGVTNDTTAIQNAINDANTAGGGVVELEAKTYAITTLTYYKGTHIKGTGGWAFSNVPTVLSQISGTANVLLKANDTTTSFTGLVVEDVLFTAFSNQAANTGGVDLSNTQYSNFIRVAVSWTKNFGFKVRGGSNAGDCMYNNFWACFANNIQSGAAGFHLEGTAQSQPDATAFFGCVVNAGAGTTGWKVRSNGSPDWIDSTTLVACRTQQVPTPFDSDGKHGHVIGGRFENTSGSATFLLSSGATTEPTLDDFTGEISASGGQVWTDTAIVKSNRATSGALITPAFSASYTPDLRFSQCFQFSLTGNITINAPLNPWPGATLRFLFQQDATGNRTVTWNAVFKTSWIPGPDASKYSSVQFFYDGSNWLQITGAASEDNGALYNKGILESQGAYIYANGGKFLVGGVTAHWDVTSSSGTHDWRNNNGGTTLLALDGSGNLSPTGNVKHSRQAPAFASSYTPNPSSGEVVTMTLTGAITVNNPTDPTSGSPMLRFVWTQDGTGGRVVTYDTKFKTGGLAAFATTASTVTIDTFMWDGANWRGVARVTGQ